MMIRLLKKYLEEQDPVEKELILNRLFEELYFYCLRSLDNMKYPRKNLYKDIVQETLFSISRRFDKLKYKNNHVQLYKYITKSVHRTLLQVINKVERRIENDQKIFENKPPEKDFDYVLFLKLLDEFVQIYKEYDEESIRSVILNVKPHFVPFYHRQKIKQSFSEYIKDTLTK